MNVWTMRDVAEDAVAELALALQVRRATAACLVGRGVVTKAQAQRHVTPRLGQLRQPDGLAGMVPAVDRIAAAIAEGETIGCFGDYDADGVTSAAVITSFVRQAGGRCVARVASRTAGYGFGEADANALIDAGAGLIVTCDCGTSDRPAIEAAAARGVDVIVIDHHTVPAADPADPHPAFALINPFRSDSTFAFRGMASVGLAFYVVVSVRTRLRQSGWFGPQAPSHPEPDVREYLDLVAIGTIADLVPLESENRVLTAIGLERLRRRARPGLEALLKAAGVAPDDPIDENTVGWKIAPRLNAPGRLGDAEPALALLLADRTQAAAAAERLEQLNDERRTEQGRVLEQALATLGDDDPGPVVVVAGEGWASGVVGIVAAKLVDRYHRPAVVIAIDAQSGEGRGSARSVDGFNLYDAMSQCSGHLMRFGGHAAAAGLTLDAREIDAFRSAMHAQVAAPGAARAGAQLIDAEVALGEVDHRLCRELDALAPFGKGNQAPVLLARDLVVKSSRRVGDGSHLKLQLEDRSGAGVSAIGFGMGESDPGAGAVIDAVFTPGVSAWGGRRTVELTLRALGALAPQTPAQASSYRVASAGTAAPG